MKLTQISSHAWISSYDDDLGWSALGLVVGEKYALAIDAGHSKKQCDEFYSLLKENNLPLPDFTVLTHWHWDHSFALSAISGTSICEENTDHHLQAIKNDASYLKELMERSKEIKTEIENGDIVVRSCNLVFENQMEMDLGNLHASLFHTTSPHTDDCTLIYIPEDKLLFVGDAICGEFPTWAIDPKKNDILISTVETIDFTIAVGGHWDPYTKEKLLDDLQHMRIK